jgi:uncharacterized protein (PEP-CTERM system associated)
VIDPSSGAPLVLTESQAQIVDEDFVEERLRAGLTIDGRRTRIQFGGSVANRNYEISNSDEDLINLDGSVTRNLGAQWSTTLSGAYEERQRQVGGDQDFYRVTLGVTKALSRRTDATLNLSYRERSSDVASEEYDENRIGFILTSSFL